MNQISKKWQSGLLTLGLLAGTSFVGNSATAQTTEHMNNTAHNGQYTVMVMKHLCNDNIKSLSDFEALESGRAPVEALANTVVNCPTTGLMGDEPVEGALASERTSYDFKVVGEKGSNLMLADSTYEQHKLCESDINLDADGNGVISSETCLDISHYVFNDIHAENGRVEVSETDAPEGYRFGTVRFTPTEVDGNNDKQSLLATDSAQGLMKFDLTNDSDKMIMLHVYNFPTADTNTDNGGENNNRAAIIKEIQELQKQIQIMQQRILDLLGKLF